MIVKVEIVKWELNIGYLIFYLHQFNISLSKFFAYTSSFEKNDYSQQ